MESCLACGQPVHPIAGRCKHCRADLVALRADAVRAARAKEKAALPREPFRHDPTPVGQIVSAPPPPATPTIAQTKPAIPSRRRRVTLVAAALAVLGVGTGAGIWAQRWYAARADEVEEDDETASDESATPKTTAAKNPLGVDPQTGFDTPPPVDPPAADPDPSPWTAPQQAPRRGPRDVGDVDAFGKELADTLCAKLTACGGLDATGIPGGTDALCEMASSAFQDPEAAERVRRGECRYDAGAATRCLDALANVSCDAANPDGMLAIADQMTACADAYACE